MVYSGISPDGSAHVNKIVSITKGESSWLLVEVTDPNNYEDEKPILQRVENSFTLEVLIPTASLAASRAESFFLHVSGTRQGDFSGVSTRAARKGWSECITYYYAAEGTTFQHMRGKLLLIIGKEIDTASPQLLEAWKSKDILPTVVLEFVRITEEGKEDVFQRIKLTNARVGPVWRFVDLRTRRQGKRERERFEEIGFTWERIESQHKVGSPFWNPDMTGSEPMCRVPKKLKDLCQ